MKTRNLTHTFTVDQTPEEAFAAINDVRGWWSGEIEGKTEKAGDVFTYRYEDIHYSQQKVIESVPGKKVVWLVLDSYLGFIEDKTEWNGTKVTFEITREGGKTRVHFTHDGLDSGHECYEACSSAWGSYVTGSLRSLIATGQGQPNAKERKGGRALQATR
jgi:hypothetical protein